MEQEGQPAQENHEQMQRGTEGKAGPGTARTEVRTQGVGGEVRRGREQGREMGTNVTLRSEASAVFPVTVEVHEKWLNYRLQSRMGGIGIEEGAEAPFLH